MKKNTATRLNRMTAGFTLTELLATLLVLTMASTMLINGIPAAQKSYAAAVDKSNALSLLSTTTTRLRDVLATADPDTVEVSPLSGNDECIVKYKSMDTGRWVYMTSESNGIFLSTSITDSSENIPADATRESLTPLKTGAGAGDTALVASFSEDDPISYSNGLFTLGEIKVARSIDNSELASVAAGSIKVRTIAVA